jgi:hypothetical protein
MMEKQKQIEEMAKDIEFRTAMAKATKRVLVSSEPIEGLLAEYLYDLGYRKIPEGAVVLTREEHQKYLAFKIIEPQVRGCLDRGRELEKRLETAIKETAEKFAERLKGMAYQSDDWSHGVHPMVVEVDYIDEICKEIIGDEQ